MMGVSAGGSGGGRGRGAWLFGLCRRHLVSATFWPLRSHVNVASQLASSLVCAIISRRNQYYQWRTQPNFQPALGPKFLKRPSSASKISTPQIRRLNSNENFQRSALNLSTPRPGHSEKPIIINARPKKFQRQAHGQTFVPRSPYHQPSTAHKIYTGAQIFLPKFHLLPQSQMIISTVPIRVGIQSHWNEEPRIFLPPLRSNF